MAGVRAGRAPEVLFGARHSALLVMKWYGPDMGLPVQESMSGVSVACAFFDALLHRASFNCDSRAAAACARSSDGPLAAETGWAGRARSAGAEGSVAL